MSFKEWWKSKSYWTRWAFIGIFIGIGINVIIAINSRVCHGENCNMLNIIDLPSFLASKLSDYAGYLEFPVSANIPHPLNSLSEVLFSLPLLFIIIGGYLLIGVFIGWIIKKIKSKKEQP